jgi:hypothetical protein
MKTPHVSHVLYGSTILALVVGCSTVEPSALPTLFVTNPNCATGQCRVIEVRAFIPDFRVPQPSWGYSTIGEIIGQGCLVFPSRLVLMVNSDTAAVWTPSHPLYLVAVDSIAFHNGDSTFSRGATRTFIPDSAAGWEVSFGEGATAELKTGPACKP